MHYATWNLDFTNPKYGTGPEEKISKIGGSAEASFAYGEPNNGATIMGYVSIQVDDAEFTNWNFATITQDQALAFCKQIDDTAYVLPDGRIATVEGE